ncbi:MAG: polyribonucleotide nucleotidyltransferase [Chloroflexi bacterium]|nr:polyribonucleotide nucleotidyltransferase [Chloroflexota bacterium]MCH8114900.1 polyribonucleotide nucleotidyltransferase [Chloroflexota bacterium]MCI0880672.1 polyribonucleotide nucleotidyltransferase [Chloroflexota bacterium]
MINKFEMEVGGRVLEIEHGRVANQAGGAVTVRYGDTMLLATATASKKSRPGADFLPLTVDVAEKAYAAGKLPGGFFKREGRPNTDAILAARMIDRPIRPLFSKTIHNEIQIIITILASDRVNPYPALGIIGASTALVISDIAFDDPIGACVIGLVEGELVVNPTYEELQTSDLELLVAGTGDATMMVESGANFVSEDVLLDALELAQEVNGAIVEQIQEIQAKVGKQKWKAPEVTAEENAAEKATRELVGEDFIRALKEPGDKAAGKNRIEELMDDAIEKLGNDHDPAHVKSTLYALETEAVRKTILEDNIRPDGRKLDELRPLNSEVGYLPRVHGSGIFTRGETQILGTLTLASAGERQRLDTYGLETEKHFIHHYNFPPYSTGEAGRFGFTGRREVGHGALAERALRPVVPTQADFPYTIRLVSEALSSNGSTSMGSVCAGTLAMMDGGVPIKAPVAGIAMGLITGENGKYAILTDIQGAEDHSGDMDFKVAGTRDGVTALQMDIKVKGITFAIIGEALQQARVARLQILDSMAEAISDTRDDLSEYAPRMISMKIPTDKIGAIIGPGGSVIRGMIDEFGVTIDVQDDGTVVIGSPDKDNAEKAENAINALTKEIEVGDTYTGRVVRIMPFGAFVQILPGKDGMVHISELAQHRVPDVESVVSIGDQLEVMVINIDGMGRIDLSHRALLEQSNEGGGGDSDGASREESREPRDRDDRGERGASGYRGDRGDRGPRGRGGDRGDRGSRGPRERDRGPRSDRRDRPDVGDERRGPRSDGDDDGARDERSERRSRRPAGGYDGSGRRSGPPRRR